jgi:hypothetical protein
VISCEVIDVRYLAAGTVNVGYTRQDTQKLIRKVLIARAKTGQQHAAFQSRVSQNSCLGFSTKDP